MDLLKASPSWAKAFAKVEEAVEKGALAAVVGKPGTGKTQMGVELVRKLSISGTNTLYVRMVELFAAVRESYGQNATTRELTCIFRFTQPKLLIIDEVQDRASTDWETRILNLVLDKRYGDAKATVLLGNLTPNELRLNIGDRAFDRLREDGVILDCDWSSFRGRAA
jgi:DNA replication protein DnaC